MRVAHYKPLSEIPAGILSRARPRYSKYCFADMNLDATWLMLSLIPSGIVFVLFVYGKKQSRWPQLAGGLLFMTYPYFTQSVTALLGVGVVLGAAVYYAVQAGW